MSNFMRKKPLNKLISAINGEVSFDPGISEISRIVTYSGAIEPGDIFVAIEGLHFDGHDFTREAIKKGAAAVVVSRPTGAEREILVSNTSEALAIMARELFEKPDDSLIVVGITGTNGKSTTTYIVSKIAEANGKNFGVIGTLGYSIGDKHYALGYTTPLVTDIYRILAEMSDAGIEGVVMEVTSHGIVQRRCTSINYDILSFTCLSQDHLDIHGSMEEYFATKASIFESADPSVTNVINIDDPYGRRLIELTPSENIITYGIENDADITAKDLKSTTYNTSFTICTPHGDQSVLLSTPGRFNVYNALCAAGIAISLGWPLSSIKRGFADFCGIKGRMDKVPGNQPFDIFIDYSHTPDALKNALSACREMADGRIIVVFGAGGDRDRDKRPKMGRIASELADTIVLTNDNPRSENPSSIIDQIENGVLKYADKYRIEDRKKAIIFALETAEPGDIVLISGKGHEDYQIIGNQRFTFDDREVASEWLTQKGFIEG